MLKLIVTRGFSLAAKSKQADFYKILGLEIDATNKDIKESFYRLSKLYHPDVTSDEIARTKFQDVARAYETLGNPILRQQYDKGLITRGSQFDLNKLKTDDKILQGYRVQSDAGTSYSNYYVRNYNKQIFDIWRQRSDPEDNISTHEYQRDKIALVFTFVVIMSSVTFLDYYYHRLTTSRHDVIYNRPDLVSKH
ncbi:DnaJ subfamily C member 30, mitochondrial [Cichlidogyrus casuarinus]|uniref:DnaJ subfamily C member 30, mitochondrial n=1 Tax=Cichlidogyrus casuarinus TaxID=1844966 RepID=A0ABD2QBN1_9PLAT